MHRYSGFLLIVCAGGCLLVGCADQKKASESSPNAAPVAKASENELSRALDRFLKQHGHHSVYLGALRGGFPIEIADVEGPDKRQLRVLENQGLLVSWLSGRTHRAKLRKYELTELGKRYYRSDDNPSGFCFGEERVGAIVKWTYDPPATASVTYRYTVDLAEWAKSADVQKEFPEIRLDLDSAGKTEKHVDFIRMGPGIDDWGAPDF